MTDLPSCKMCKKPANYRHKDNPNTAYCGNECLKNYKELRTEIIEEHKKTLPPVEARVKTVPELVKEAEERGETHVKISDRLTIGVEFYKLMSQ